MKFTATFRNGAFTALLITAVGEITNLLLGYFLVKWIGADGFGRLEVIKSGVLVLGSVVCLGLPNALIRFLPYYEARQEWGLAKGVVTGFWRASFVAGFVGGVFTISIAEAVDFFSDRYSTSRFDIVCLACGTLLIVVMSLQESIARVQREMILALSPRYLFWGLLIILIFMVIPSSLRTSEVGLLILLVSLAIVTFLQGIILRFKCRKVCFAGPVVAHEYQWRKWMKGALPLLFVSASYRVLRHVDILLIAAFINKDCAGIYAVAITMNVWILFPLIAGNAIGGPLYATLIAKNDVDELDRLMTGYTVWVFIPSLLLAIFLALNAPFILSLFGDSFSSAYLPFLIVAAGELINVGTGAVGWILQVSGNERTCAIGFVGAALLNIGLAILFIPIFGMEGAAIATALANIARNIFMLRVVKKELLLDPSLWGTIRRSIKK